MRQMSVGNEETDHLPKMNLSVLVPGILANWFAIRTRSPRSEEDQGGELYSTLRIAPMFRPVMIPSAFKVAMI